MCSPKLRELYHFSNLSTYEQMPSGDSWEREEWSVISVFILPANLDIFQQVKVPNGRCQKALASHVVLEGRTSSSSMWSCQSHTEAVERAHSEKSKPQTWLNQSSARCHYGNKALLPKISCPEKHSTQDSHKRENSWVQWHLSISCPSDTLVKLDPSVQRRKWPQNALLSLQRGIVFTRPFFSYLKVIIQISCICIIIAFWKCFKIY